jgi:hypothetical protein
MTQERQPSLHVSINYSSFFLFQFLSIEFYTKTKKNRYISSPLPLKQIVWNRK